MKPRKRLLPTMLLILPTALYAEGLKPFTSDGCSSFPDGTPKQQTLWLQCCHDHDLAYWKGGTEAERALADKALHDCVAQVGEPEIADMMEAGVRVGGSPWLPTRFRWGYGWPFPRGYRALTAEELKEVAQRLAERQ